MRLTNRPLALLLLAVLLVAGCSGGGAAAQPTPASTATAEIHADPPAATATAPATSVPAAALPADRIKVVANTKTEYYTVYGSDSNAILASIQANAPLDQNGARAVGLTTYTPNLDWDTNHDSRACAISRMTIRVDMTVTLPSLDNPGSLPSSLQALWANYAAGVAAHEQHHVDIWLQGADAIRQQMVAIAPTQGCSVLEAKVLDVWNTQQDASNKAQDQFHQQEAARLEAARAPLKSQIDVNKNKLDALAAQIAGLDDSLAALSQQIGPLKTLLDSLEAQIGAIEDKYRSTGVPDDVRDQYQRLISQYNNLIPSYNTLIGQYNAQLAQRGKLADQADALRNQTNDLVDQYNWTR